MATQKFKLHFIGIIIILHYAIWPSVFLFWLLSFFFNSPPCSFPLLFPHDNCGPIPRCSHHSQRLEFLSVLLSSWLISSLPSSFYTNLNFSVEVNPATFPALTFIVSTLLLTFWCTIEFIYLLNLSITIHLSYSKNISSTRTEHWFIQSCVPCDQNSDGT